MAGPASLPSPTALIEAAIAEGGHDDLGDEGGVLDGLTRYLTAMEREAGLSPAGVGAITADVTGQLVNRLRLEADVRAHPEILEEEVRSPLVIVGLMRTGTSKLLQLLARDDTALHLPYWLLLNPAPFPGGATGDADPRIALADQVTTAMAEQFPEFMAAHPTRTHEPEEDVLLMRMTFESQANAIFDHIPSFLEWQKGQPREHAYRYLHRALQYLQWQQGGGQGRPWILKSPLHLANLDLLVDLFPGTTVVHCHREVGPVIASSLRTLEATWQARGGQLPPIAARSLFEFWCDQITANLRLRAQLGDRLSVIDVTYQDIVANPLQVVRSIYQTWKRPLTAETEQKLMAWNSDNPQHRFGRLDYSLDRYGLDPHDVEQSLAPYLDRFDMLGVNGVRR